MGITVSIFEIKMSGPARMYSVTQRGNSVFTLYTTVLAHAALIISIIGYYYNDSRPRHFDVTSDVELLGIVALNPDPYIPSIDSARLRFKLSYNLTNVWHWNTKYILPSVACVYKRKGDSTFSHDVVLWDDRAELPHHTVRSYGSVPAEYALADVANTLRGARGYLEVRWTVLPWNGVSRTYRGARTPEFDFPAEYTGRG